MRALLKNQTGICVDTLPAPAVTRDDDVIIDIAFAGLCRTDVLAGEGRMPAKGPQLVLGHEFSGIVCATGDRAAADIKNGARVTVMPVLPNGSCPLCRAGRGDSPAWLAQAVEDEKFDVVLSRDRKSGGRGAVPLAVPTLAALSGHLPPPSKAV